MAEADKNSNSFIRSVERVCDILGCFTLEHPELGISELSRLTGMYKSTVFRIIQTLESRGMLVQDLKSKKYVLGFKIFELGAVAGSNMEVRRVALPFMEELGERTRETINLNIEHMEERVCIEMVESREAIRNFVQVGIRSPLYFGATGKTLLAFLPQDRIDAVISRGMVSPVDGKVIDRKELMSQLSEIRQRHYCASQEERVMGAASVCAPIKDYSNRVVAVLTISGPAARFTPDRLPKLVSEVKETALIISRRLGFNGEF